MKHGKKYVDSAKTVDYNELYESADSFVSNCWQFVFKKNHLLL